MNINHNKIQDKATHITPEVIIVLNLGVVLTGMNESGFLFVLGYCSEPSGYIGCVCCR